MTDPPFVHQPPQQGSIFQTLSSLYSLYTLQTNNPTSQSFTYLVIFFVFTIVIPVLGGVVIILYRFLKTTMNRTDGSMVVEKSSGSWIPIIGPYLEFNHDYISYLNNETKRLGNTFTIDLLYTELLFTNDPEFITKLITPGSTDNTECSYLVHIAREMGLSIDCEYRIRMKSYFKIANETFGEHSFLEQHKPQLIAVLLKTVENDRRNVNLGELCSVLYLKSMLCLCFGQKFVEDYGDEMVQDLYQSHHNLSPSFTKFLSNYGIPIGTNQHSKRFLTRFKNLVLDEISQRKENPNVQYTDYLQSFIIKKISRRDIGVVWSHILHLILSVYNPSVTTLTFTTYHLLHSLQLQTKLDKDPRFIKQMMIESERLYSPTTISLQLIKDIQIGNTIVKAGRTVTICPDLNNLKQENYENPNIYDPNRWNRKKKIDQEKKRGRLLVSEGLYSMDLGLFNAVVERLVGEVLVPFLWKSGVKLAVQDHALEDSLNRTTKILIHINNDSKKNKQ